MTRNLSPELLALLHGHGRLQYTGTLPLPEVASLLFGEFAPVYQRPRRVFTLAEPRHNRLWMEGRRDFVAGVEWYQWLPVGSHLAIVMVLESEPGARCMGRIVPLGQAQEVAPYAERVRASVRRGLLSKDALMKEWAMKALTAV